MRPTKKQIKNGTYKYIGIIPNGEWHRKCTGPAHDQPEYLPATEKYFYFHKSGKSKGKPVARCRLCNNWSKVKSPGSYHGLIPVSVAQKYFIEATNHIGLMELSRRTGLSRTTIRKGITAIEGSIHKSVLRKVMLELTSIQRKNEYSISAAAKWRIDRRLNRNYEVCSGCGTPKANFTIGCENCNARFYDQYRRGHITESEWNKIKEQIRPSSPY